MGVGIGALAPFKWVPTEEALHIFLDGGSWHKNGVHATPLDVVPPNTVQWPDKELRLIRQISGRGSDYPVTLFKFKGRSQEGYVLQHYCLHGVIVLRKQTGMHRKSIALTYTVSPYHHLTSMCWCKRGGGMDTKELET